MGRGLLKAAPQKSNGGEKGRGNGGGGDGAGRGRGAAKAGAKRGASAAQAKRAAGGAASCSAAAAEPAPKRKVAETAVCHACGVPSTDVEWKAYSMKGGKRCVVGSGCLECYRTWAASRQGDGDFESVMMQCASDDQYCDAFLADNAVRKGNAQKDFHEADVDEVKISGVRAYRSLIGLTEAQFETRFGCKPKDLGYRLQDLTSEAGVGYRGVLMVDDERPEVRYELQWDISRRLQSHRLLAKNHLHKGQDEDAFQELVRESNERGSMAQRLRSCTLTKDEILKQVEEKARRDALAPKRQDRSSDSEEDGDSESDIEENPLATAPVKDGTMAQKLKSSRRAASTVGGGGSASAGAWGDTASMLGATVVLDSEDGGTEGEINSEKKRRKFDTQDHIANIHPNKILAGVPMMRQIRFARRHCDDLDPDNVLRGMLQERLDLADTAVKFVQLDLLNADKAQVDKHLKPLMDAKVEMPTDIKENLLARHLTAMTAGNLGDNFPLLNFLGAVTPWADQFADSHDDGDFDIENPTLRSVEGAPAHKAQFFVDNMMNLFILPMLKLGEPGRRAMEDKTKIAVDFFDCAFERDLADEYVSALRKVSGVLQGISCLLDPMSLEYFDDCCTLCDASGDGKTSSVISPFTMARLTMAKDTSYREIMADFVATMAGTKMHMQTLKKHLKSLSAGDLSLNDLSSVLRDWGRLSQSMRQGCKKALFDGMQPKVNKHLAACKALLEKSGEASPADLADIEGYAAFLTLVRDSIPGEFPSVVSLLARANKASSDVQGVVALRAFVNGIQKFVTAKGEGDGVDMVGLETLGKRAAMGAVRDQAPANIIEEAATRLLDLQGFVMDSGDVRSDLAVNSLKLAKLVLDLLPAKKYDNERNISESLASVNTLAENKAEFEGSGASPVERLGKIVAGKHPKLMNMLASMKKVQLVSTEVRDPSDKYKGFLEQELGKFKSFFEKHVGVLLDGLKEKVMRHKQLVADLSEGNLSFSGTDWKASLAEGYSWQDLKGLAKQKVLSLKQGDQFKEATDIFGRFYEEYKEASELYEVKTHGESVADVGKCFNESNILSIEARAFLCFDLITEKKALRKALLALQKDN